MPFSRRNQPLINPPCKPMHPQSEPWSSRRRSASASPNRNSPLSSPSIGQKLTLKRVCTRLKIAAWPITPAFAPSSWFSSSQIQPRKSNSSAKPTTNNRTKASRSRCTDSALWKCAQCPSSSGITTSASSSPAQSKPRKRASGREG